MSNYEWSEWGECTQSCSDPANNSTESMCGHKTRLGVCPVNKSCEGDSEQKMECNCQKCPVIFHLESFHQNSDSICKFRVGRVFRV